MNWLSLGMDTHHEPKKNWLNLKSGGLNITSGLKTVDTCFDLAMLLIGYPHGKELRRTHYCAKIAKHPGYVQHHVVKQSSHWPCSILQYSMQPVCLTVSLLPSKESNKQFIPTKLKSDNFSPLNLYDLIPPTTAFRYTMPFVFQTIQTA